MNETVYRGKHKNTKTAIFLSINRKTELKMAKTAKPQTLKTPLYAVLVICCQLTSYLVYIGVT